MLCTAVITTRWPVKYGASAELVAGGAFFVAGMAPCRFQSAVLFQLQTSHLNHFLSRSNTIPALVTVMACVYMCTISAVSGVGRLAGRYLK